MTTTPATRHSLLVRLRDASDQQAWREFVQVYEPVVYGMARKSGLQDADAHDLTQEVLSAVSRAIGDWQPDPERGRFRAWLYRIARNMTINSLSRRAHQPRGTGDTQTVELLAEFACTDPDENPSFELEYRRRAFHRAAQRVQAEVAPATWQAFWLTSVEHAPIAKVAETLQLSKGVIYAARSRVLARLRAVVQQLEGEAE